MSWQPIETAPKEWYKTILTWSGEYCALACHWESDGQWHGVCNGYELDHIGDGDDGGRLDPQPTHWMPLPEAPE